MTSTLKADIIEAATTDGVTTIRGNGTNSVAISDNTAITGTLSATGASTLTGATTVGSTLGVTGETTLTGGLASDAGNQVAGSKNIVINGAQTIAQRGAVITGAGEATYGVDRFRTRTYGGDGRYSISAWQVDVPPSENFQWSTLYTVTTASTNTGTYGYGLEYMAEGYDSNRLSLGKAGAKAFTVSFWVKVSIGGTYTSAVRTAGGEQSFVWEHTLAAATWTKVTKTIPALTTTLSSGQYTTSAMLLISPINFGAQTSKNTTTLNAWHAGNYVFTANQVALMDTINATCHLTGLQCEEGPIATPFEHEPHMLTFAKCQRYYQKSYADATTPGTSVGSHLQAKVDDSTYNFVKLPPMVWFRAAPTVTVYSTTGASGKIRNLSAGTDIEESVGSYAGGILVHNTSAVTSGQNIALHYTANAEL